MFLSYLWGMETLRIFHVHWISHTCSYPTYEEWKRRIFDQFHIITFSSVLILPMRNGNLAMHSPSTNVPLVLILPMRNGNALLYSFFVFRNIVLILPMRNGNYNCEGFYFRMDFSSYPTYEEWKLFSILILILKLIVLILPMRNGNFVSSKLQ